MKVEAFLKAQTSKREVVLAGTRSKDLLTDGRNFSYLFPFYFLHEKFWALSPLFI